MGRKRLTASTLDDERLERTGAQAVDLAERILGAGAVDKEIVASARLLTKSVGPRGIAALHRMASRVAAESGDIVPGTLEDEGKYDSRDTQEYVAEHEVTPDHSVLDVVLHEKDPTHNPTAAKSKRRAAEDDEINPDLEEPDDIELDEEDHVDDDETDHEDEDEVDDEKNEEDEDHPIHPDEDDDTDHIPDDELEGEHEELDETDEDHPELGEDDGEFTMDDMEELENMGVDGVLTSARIRRTKDGKVIKGRQASRLAQEDAERDADRAYRESLEAQAVTGSLEDKSRRSRKASKTKSQQESSFRPSRTRIASSPAEENEFDAVWNDPDVSSEFAD